MKKTKYILTFKEWLIENQGGSPATPLNTPGMGNVTPPSPKLTGSADTFGSQFLYTQIDKEEEEEDEEENEE